MPGWLLGIRLPEVWIRRFSRSRTRSVVHSVLPKFPHSVLLLGSYRKRATTLARSEDWNLESEAHGISFSFYTPLLSGLLEPKRKLKSFLRSRIDATPKCQISIALLAEGES